jgi:hypothetical protein
VCGCNVGYTGKNCTECVAGFEAAGADCRCGTDRYVRDGACTACGANATATGPDAVTCCERRTVGWEGVVLPCTLVEPAHGAPARWPGPVWMARGRIPCRGRPGVGPVWGQVSVVSLRGLPLSFCSPLHGPPCTSCCAPACLDFATYITANDTCGEGRGVRAASEERRGCPKIAA